MSRKKDYAATRIQAMARQARRSPTGASVERKTAVHRRQQQLQQDRERIAKAMLQACHVVQRAYRCHLARRQRRFLALRRARSHELPFATHAERRSTVVAAVPAVRGRTSRSQSAPCLSDALVRAQRMKLQMEEEERASLLELR